MKECLDSTIITLNQQIPHFATSVSAFTLFQLFAHNLRYSSQHFEKMWNKKPTRCHLVLYLFPLYKLIFISCSTCFGSPCAHLQELTTLWYFFTCGVVPWLCRQSDPAGWLCVHWGVRSTTQWTHYQPAGSDCYTSTALHHT